MRLYGHVALADENRLIPSGKAICGKPVKGPAPMPLILCPCCTAALPRVFADILVRPLLSSTWRAWTLPSKDEVQP